MPEIPTDLHGVCPNCEMGSGFKIVESQAQVWPKRYGPSQLATIIGTEPPYAGTILVECFHCERTALFIERTDPFVDRSDPENIQLSRRTSFSQVLPRVKPRPLREEVPDSIRTFFEEAGVCEAAGAMRGAAVLYRAAVEALVKDQGASGPNLYERIGALKNTQASPELIADLHEARLLGNDSIHDGLTYSAEEVADVAELIVEAVTVLYVQPAERAKMREARKSRRTGS